MFTQFRFDDNEHVFSLKGQFKLIRIVINFLREKGPLFQVLGQLEGRAGLLCGIDDVFKTVEELRGTKTGGRKTRSSRKRTRTSNSGASSSTPEAGPSTPRRRVETAYFLLVDMGLLCSYMFKILCRNVALVRAKHDRSQRLVLKLVDGPQEADVASFASKYNVTPPILHASAQPMGHAMLQEYWGPSLASRLKKVNSMPASICWDLIRLLKVLHNEAGIAHRDIKPDNIVVNDDYVANFIDFELSIEDATETTKGIDDVGTPGWKAPEVHRGEHLLFAADIWAMGKVLKHVLNSGALRPDETIDDVHRVVVKFQADDPQERLQALDSFQDFATFAAQTVDTKIDIPKEQDESLLAAKKAKKAKTAKKRRFAAKTAEKRHFAAETANKSLFAARTAKTSCDGTRIALSRGRPVKYVTQALRLVQTILSIGKALVTGQ